jgi:hypothetical protein
LGQGWNETDWSVPRQPNRQDLDKVAPNHPVLLWRCDLHLAVANSAALRLAGINRDTPDPPEGRIEREIAPTGNLSTFSKSWKSIALKNLWCRHCRNFAIVLNMYR